MTKIINFLIKYSVKKSLMYDYISEGVTAALLFLTIITSFFQMLVLSEILLGLTIVSFIICVILNLLTGVRGLIDYMDNRENRGKHATPQTKQAQVSKQN